ncbi:MAG: diaminopimelate decarboxylase [Verrucomicrobiota bacterium]
MTQLPPTPQPRACEQPELLAEIAAKVGTPFYLYEAPVLRAAISDVRELTAHEGLQARYAMKANSARPVLDAIREAGIWIDAVSANECHRAAEAGFARGHQPPVILYTADVFRDGWREALDELGVLPNLGSPGMVADLASIGYRGPVGLRLNPGFGHGHVNACDTGGPSSKHGIWMEDLSETLKHARRESLSITLLHAHVGSGPRQEELWENLDRLAACMASHVDLLPDLEAVSLGGGLPYDYRGHEPLQIAPLKDLLERAQAALSKAAGRPLRVEIEPGRYYVAGCGSLVARVTDLKETRTNEKGPGARFIMTDAGFTDLIRPAMYGSYHRIEIPARQGEPEEPMLVSGPLCESGDVFTQEAGEIVAPRPLPVPRAGDLLVVRDAGAYGYTMASHYNSLGRAPQVWREADGSCRLISRRESWEDVLRAECDEPL